MKRTLVWLTVVTGLSLTEFPRPLKPGQGQNFPPNSASHPEEHAQAQTIPPPPEAFEELGYRFRRPDVGVRPLREAAPAATVTVTVTGIVTLPSSKTMGLLWGIKTCSTSTKARCDSRLTRKVATSLKNYLWFGTTTLATP